MKNVEQFCSETTKLKEKIAREIYKTKQQVNTHHQLTKLISLKDLKIIRDSVEKQDKDL